MMNKIFARAIYGFLMTAISLGAFAAPSTAQLTGAAAGDKTIMINNNVGKNQLVWVSTAPLESIRGLAESISGSMVIDPANLTGMCGTIVVDTKSMKTGNQTRDDHLWSAEWMNAAKYPKITFTFTSVSDVKVSGNTATGYANGEFTMHGVTKHIVVPFGMAYIPASEKTAQRAPGDFVSFTAKFTIALKDFNIAGTEGVVGSKVGETVDISAQLFGNTQQTSNP